MQGKYTVFIRDKNGQFVDRLNDFVNLHILMTLNDIGSWNLTSVSNEQCPFKAGNGIVVPRNGKYLYSGVVTEISDNYDATKNLYKWKVSGKGDLEYLNRRICYVDPATGRTDTVSHYVDSGVLSEVVRRLIQKNIGVQALYNRREAIVKDFQQTPTGQSVNISLRFQNLLRTTAALVTSNGYNIRANWDNEYKKVYYDIFQGKDLTNSIVFTEQLRNIISSEHIASAPVGNFILAGGTGEMTARNFVNAQNDASIDEWGRIEFYQDSRNQHNVESYVHEVLKEKSTNNVGYGCSASNAENTPQFGVDYNLGDYVGMKIFGEFITAQVQQCEIKVSEGGETIEPHFGTVAIGKLRSIFRQLEDLRNDVNELLGTEIE